MKRTSLMAVSLAVLAALFTQTGCRTQAEFDKLYAAWQTCEGARDNLEKQLATAASRIEGLEGEKRAWEASGAAIQGSLRDQLKSLKDEYDKLMATNADLLKQLAERRPPDVIIGTALPTKVDEALKALVQKYPGKIEYDAQRGVVRFSSDLLFDLGSYTLKAEVAKQLSDFAEVINLPDAQAFDVLVVGHTDNVRIVKPGTKEITPTNWHLSVYRAVSVVEALNKAGVGVKRLGAMGFGEERPRVPNKPAGTAGGTPENRRVEVFLVPKSSLAATGLAPLVLPGEAFLAALGQ